eukprot:1300536-Prymnesium_polylepis.1
MWGALGRNNGERCVVRAGHEYVRVAGRARGALFASPQHIHTQNRACRGRTCTVYTIRRCAVNRPPPSSDVHAAQG